MAGVVSVCYFLYFNAAGFMAFHIGHSSWLVFKFSTVTCAEREREVRKAARAGREVDAIGWPHN